MKITIIQGAFLPVPAIQGGAVEKIWHKMGSEFAARGHEVVHISRAYPGLEPKELLNGVTHLRVKGYDTPASLPLLKLLDLFYTIRAIRSLPDDSDVIVTNTFWAPILLRGARARKVYVDVQRVPKGQMKFYTHVGVLRGCSPAICSAVAAELLPKAEGIVSYVPNPVPFEVDETLSNRGNTILFVGRLHPEKGVHVLLDALRKFPADLLESWKMVIVGPWEPKDGGGGTSYFNSLKEAAAGLPVEFTGPIFDERELKLHFASSSIFCYPAQEGSGDAAPVAPREAMAYGCVPVVSMLPCFNDFIHDGINGLCYDHRAENQEETLAHALRSLAENPIKLENLSTNAKRVMDEYSSTAVAEAFLADFSKRIINR